MKAGLKKVTMRTLDEIVPEDQRMDIQEVKAYQRLTEQHVEHPWLKAKQTWQKNFDGKYRSKKRKPAREDTDIVDIHKWPLDPSKHSDEKE